MPLDALLTYLTEKSSDSVRQWLSLFCRNPRLVQFLHTHRVKVRARLANKPFEDSMDLVLELECAALLLENPQYLVEYEPFLATKKRSPDLLVRAQDQMFAVEVKRIRASAAHQMVDACVDAIRTCYRQIPSGLGIMFSPNDPRPEFPQELNDALPAILAQLPARILHYDKLLKAEEVADWAVPGFEDDEDLVFHFCKPTMKDPSTPTADFGGSGPIRYTDNEWKTFGNAIRDKLGQLLQGIPNVLFVATHSFTHEADDAERAIAALCADVAFIEKAADLSALVFRDSFVPGGHRNFVWTNQHARNCLGSTTIDYLRTMNHSP